MTWKSSERCATASMVMPSVPDYRGRLTVVRGGSNAGAVAGAQPVPGLSGAPSACPTARPPRSVGLVGWCTLRYPYAERVQEIGLVLQADLPADVTAIRNRYADGGLTQQEHWLEDFGVSAGMVRRIVVRASRGQQVAGPLTVAPARRCPQEAPHGR